MNFVAQPVPVQKKQGAIQGQVPVELDEQGMSTIPILVTGQAEVGKKVGIPGALIPSLERLRGALPLDSIDLTWLRKPFRVGEELLPRPDGDAVDG